MLLFKFNSMKDALADAKHKANSPTEAESRENRTDIYQGNKPKEFNVKIRGKVKTVKGWL